MREERINVIENDNILIEIRFITHINIILPDRIIPFKFKFLLILLFIFFFYYLLTSFFEFLFLTSPLSLLSPLATTSYLGLTSLLASLLNLLLFLLTGRLRFDLLSLNLSLFSLYISLFHAAFTFR